MSLNQFLAYLEALGNWKRGNIQTNLCFLSIWCIQPACHKLFSRKICGIYWKDILPEFTRQNFSFYINVIQPFKILTMLLKRISQQIGIALQRTNEKLNMLHLREGGVGNKKIMACFFSTTP